jgi:hypothetical protein
LPVPLRTTASNKLALHVAIATLRRYSLVDATPEFISVHRLVQVVVRDRLEPRDYRRFHETADRLEHGVSDSSFNVEHNGDALSKRTGREKWGTLLRVRVDAQLLAARLKAAFRLAMKHSPMVTKVAIGGLVLFAAAILGQQALVLTNRASISVSIPVAAVILVLGVVATVVSAVSEALIAWGIVGSFLAVSTLVLSSVFLFAPELIHPDPVATKQRTALADSALPSVSGNVFQDMWGVVTDPFKLKAASGELSASVERALIQLNALEATGNYHVQQRHQQIRAITQEVIEKGNSAVANALYRMTAFEKQINNDAFALIVRGECAANNVDARLQGALSEVMKQLIKADPRIEIAGFKAAEFILSPAPIPHPNEAYRDAKSKAFRTLDKITEQSGAADIVWTYQNLR